MEADQPEKSKQTWIRGDEHAQKSPNHNLPGTFLSSSSEEVHKMKGEQLSLWGTISRGAEMTALGKE